MNRTTILPEGPERAEFLERIKKERRRARKEAQGMFGADEESKILSEGKQSPLDQLVLYSGPKLSTGSVELPSTTKKCKFPDDIETLMDKYKLECNKGEYKRLSLLVHPDRNPSECKQDADKYFSNLNALKMKCEQKNQPGCKYRTVGANVSEIAENHQELENLHPDSLMKTLNQAYKNNCNPNMYLFLKKHLLPEENTNCEEDASDHRKELESIFNNRCNKSATPQPRPRRPLSQGNAKQRQQRRRPSPQERPQERPKPQKRQTQRKSPISLRKRSHQRRSPQRRSPQKNVSSLKAEAKKLGCRGYSKLTKSELIKFINKCKKSPKSNTVSQLRAEAKKKGCKGYSTLNKAELIKFIKKC